MSYTQHALKDTVRAPAELLAPLAKQRYVKTHITPLLAAGFTDDHKGEQARGTLEHVIASKLTFTELKELTRQLQNIPS